MCSSLHWFVSSYKGSRISGFLWLKYLLNCSSRFSALLFAFFFCSALIWRICSSQMYSSFPNNECRVLNCALLNLCASFLSGAILLQYLQQHDKKQWKESHFQHLHLRNCVCKCEWQCTVATFHPITAQLSEHVNNDLKSAAACRLSEIEWVSNAGSCQFRVCVCVSRFQCRYNRVMWSAKWGW